MAHVLRTPRSQAVKFPLLAATPVSSPRCLEVVAIESKRGHVKVPEPLPASLRVPPVVADAATPLFETAGVDARTSNKPVRLAVKEHRKTAYPLHGFGVQHRRPCDHRPCIRQDMPGSVVDDDPRPGRRVGQAAILRRHYACRLVGVFEIHSVASGREITDIRAAYLVPAASTRIRCNLQRGRSPCAPRNDRIFSTALLCRSAGAGLAIRKVVPSLGCGFS